jgi:hypothetical protein
MFCLDGDWQDLGSRDGNRGPGPRPVTDVTASPGWYGGHQCVELDVHHNIQYHRNVIAAGTRARVAVLVKVFSRH